MVTLGSKRIHLALTDSRGIGVLEHIQRLNKSGECFDLQAYKGATFRDLIGIAEGYLPKHDFDVIYIAGGANDITYKDKKTNMIHYRWGSGEDLKTHLVSILHEADKKLTKNFPASRIVFCPLVGSELERVVNAHPIEPSDQEAVEEAVWEFNTQVFKINNRRGMRCPSLHHQVHRFCKGKRGAYYFHLVDGLHLNEDLKTKWAKSFLKAMAHN